MAHENSSCRRRTDDSHGSPVFWGPSGFTQTVGRTLEIAIEICTHFRGAMTVWLELVSETHEFLLSATVFVTVPNCAYCARLGVSSFHW
eukprot:COSAG02_NODE_30595_length_548_cov_1.191537_1_plen_88_part_10